MGGGVCVWCECVIFECGVWGVVCGVWYVSAW